MGKILCVGAVMVDMVARVPALPVSGEGAVIEQMSTTMGGCAFNSANIIRQLGVPCFLFAPVGQGIYAGFVRNQLAQRGMSALEIEDAKQDCGAALCFVEPDGQRTMVTLPGIERVFEKEWFSQVDPSEFSSAFIGGYEVDGAGGAAIIEFFEANPDILLTYSPGPRVMEIDPDKTARINALHPIWHLNDQEAVAYASRTNMAEATSLLEATTDRAALIAESARSIQRECQNTVIVTAGASGSYAFFGDDCAFVPSTPVRPVDTIGAGDSHLGAIMAAREAGLSWEEALKLANKVAASVCQVHGSTIPDGSECFSKALREA